MATAKDVSEVFLRLSQPELGDTISNLKIQKLVYYAQGFHIALYEKPLFEENIVNWEHGPVVEELYHEYKKFENGPIIIDGLDEKDFSLIFNTDQIDLIVEVNEIYGQFSAWKLRNMTHEEKPWLETQRNEVISHTLLYEYFTTQIIK